MNPNSEELNAIREGVRALCAEFDAAYWRRIDEQRGFPEAFVKVPDRRRLALGDDPGGVRRFRSGPGRGPR